MAEENQDNFVDQNYESPLRGEEIVELLYEQDDNNEINSEDLIGTENEINQENQYISNFDSQLNVLPTSSSAHLMMGSSPPLDSIPEQSAGFIPAVSNDSEANVYESDEIPESYNIVYDDNHNIECVDDVSQRVNDDNSDELQIEEHKQHIDPIYSTVNKQPRNSIQYIDPLRPLENDDSTMNIEIPTQEQIDDSLAYNENRMIEPDNELEADDICDEEGEVEQQQQQQQQQQSGQEEQQFEQTEFDPVALSPQLEPGSAGVVFAQSRSEEKIDLDFGRILSRRGERGAVESGSFRHNFKKKLPTSSSATDNDLTLHRRKLLEMQDSSATGASVESSESTGGSLKRNQLVSFNVDGQSRSHAGRISVDLRHLPTYLTNKRASIVDVARGAVSSLFQFASGSNSSSNQKRDSAQSSRSPSEASSSSDSSPSSDDEPIFEEPIAPTLSLGQRVAWVPSGQGPEFGTVGWIGQLPEIEDDWVVGVIFDNMIGDCDGSYKGNRYFYARQDYAMFLPLNALTKTDNYIGRPETGTMLSRMSIQLKPGQMISIQRSSIRLQHCFLNAPHQRVGHDVRAVSNRLHCQCHTCGPCAHLTKQGQRLHGALPHFRAQHTHHERKKNSLAQAAIELIAHHHHHHFHEEEEPHENEDRQFGDNSAHACNYVRYSCCQQNGAPGHDFLADCEMVRPELLDNLIHAPKAPTHNRRVARLRKRKNRPRPDQFASAPISEKVNDPSILESNNQNNMINAQINNDRESIAANGEQAYTEFTDKLNPKDENINILSNYTESNQTNTLSTVHSTNTYESHNDGSYLQNQQDQKGSNTYLDSYGNVDDHQDRGDDDDDDEGDDEDEDEDDEDADDDDDDEDDAIGDRNGHDSHHDGGQYNEQDGIMASKQDYKLSTPAANRQKAPIMSYRTDLVNYRQDNNIYNNMDSHISLMDQRRFIQQRDSSAYVHTTYSFGDNQSSVFNLRQTRHQQHYHSGQNLDADSYSSSRLGKRLKRCFNWCIFRRRRRHHNNYRARDFDNSGGDTTDDGRKDTVSRLRRKSGNSKRRKQSSSSSIRDRMIEYRRKQSTFVPSTLAKPIDDFATHGYIMPPAGSSSSALIQNQFEYPISSPESNAFDANLLYDPNANNSPVAFDQTNCSTTSHSIQINNVHSDDRFNTLDWDGQFESSGNYAFANKDPNLKYLDLNDSGRGNGEHKTRDMSMMKGSPVEDMNQSGAHSCCQSSTCTYTKKSLTISDETDLGFIDINSFNQTSSSNETLKQIVDCCINDEVSEIQATNDYLANTNHSPELSLYLNSNHDGNGMNSGIASSPLAYECEISSPTASVDANNLLPPEFIDDAQSLDNESNERLDQLFQQLAIENSLNDGHYPNNGNL